MIGAIFGDIVGSIYEFRNVKDYDFRLISNLSHPTDDTWMTLAVAIALIESQGKSDDEIKEALIKRMQEIGRKHKFAGYGLLFTKWLLSDDPKPYDSYGNGSAMRVSSVGWLYPTLYETRKIARLTAEVSHNHPEGIKGAEAVASAIYLARTGKSKEEILGYVTENFGYYFIRTLDEIRPSYSFDSSCQGSVPEAFTAFKEGNDYEDVIRKAVSLGGDSDTIACIAGGIAEAYYGMPNEYASIAIDSISGEYNDFIIEFEILRKLAIMNGGKDAFFDNQK